MLNKVRNELMKQDNETPLSGTVEVDSAYVGEQLHEGQRSRLRAQGRSNQGPATKDRAVVFGAVERGGSIRAAVVGTSQAQAMTTSAIQRTLHEFVLPRSMVFTDDWGGYNALARTGRYTFRRVKHSQRVYVSGDVHEHDRRVLRPLQDRRARNPPLHLQAVARLVPGTSGSGSGTAATTTTRCSASCSLALRRASRPFEPIRSKR
jgi:hypothetical protein